MTLAQEYLITAHGLCDSDPLLLNEMGVVFYHLDHLADAVQLFQKSLRIAQEIDSDPQVWLATRANLGHAYRRQHQWSRALKEFEEVARRGTGASGGGKGGSGGNIHCAKGLVLLEMGRCWEAIGCLHEALSFSPQDPVATDLLARALEENAVEEGWWDEDGSGGRGGDNGDGSQGQRNGVKNQVERTEELLEEAFETKRREIQWRKNRGKARAPPQRQRQPSRMSEGGEDSMMVMSDDEGVD